MDGQHHPEPLQTSPCIAARRKNMKKTYSTKIIFVVKTLHSSTEKGGSLQKTMSWGTLLLQNQRRNGTCKSLRAPMFLMEIVTGMGVVHSSPLWDGEEEGRERGRNGCGLQKLFMHGIRLYGVAFRVKGPPHGMGWAGPPVRYTRCISTLYVVCAIYPTYNLH